MKAMRAARGWRIVRGSLDPRESYGMACGHCATAWEGWTASKFEIDEALRAHTHACIARLSLAVRAPR